MIAGQSLLRQISEGLRSADFAIVVLSPHFFNKKWPQEELDGLFTLETAERKIIIPIWHNVIEVEVKQFSAILAARVAITKKDLDQIVADITKAVTYAERQKEIDDPVKSKFAAINRTAAMNRKFEELGTREQGVRLVWDELANLYTLLESRIAELRGELPLPIVRDSSHKPVFFIMVYGPRRFVLRFNIRKIYLNSLRETTLEVMHYFEHEDYRGSFEGIQLIDQTTYTPFFNELDRVIWIFVNDRSAYSSADVVSRSLNAFASRIQQVLENTLLPSNTVQ